MPLYRNDSLDNVLFIHIPKTGGTSIERSLSNYPESFFNKYKRFNVTPQHFYKDDYDYLNISAIVDYSFCVVRDPFDRLYSEYKYRLRNKKKIIKFLDFNSFVFYLKRVGVDNCYLDNHVRPQSHFILDDTKVYKFEEGINDIIIRVSKEYGFSHCNLGVYEKKSEPHDLERFREVENMVFSLYKSDYDSFSYTPYFTNNSIGYFKKKMSYFKSYFWRFLK